MLGAVVIGGSWWFAADAGTSFGNQAGSGAKDAITIVGIAAGVGIIIYAIHKSGKK